MQPHAQPPMGYFEQPRVSPPSFLPDPNPAEFVPPEIPGYDLRERDVFQYHDGQRSVWGDPLAIRRRLEAHLGNVDRVLAMCHAAEWPGTGERPADWQPAEAAVMAAAQARSQLIE